MTDTLRIPGLATLLREHQRDDTPPNTMAADVLTFVARWAQEPAQVEKAAQYFWRGWSHFTDADKNALHKEMAAAIAALFGEKT